MWVGVGVGVWGGWEGSQWLALSDGQLANPDNFLRSHECPALSSSTVLSYLILHHSVQWFSSTLQFHFGASDRPTNQPHLRRMGRAKRRIRIFFILALS